MRWDTKLLLAALAAQLVDVIWTFHAVYYNNCYEMNPWVRPFLELGIVPGALALARCTILFAAFNLVAWWLGRRLEPFLGFNVLSIISVLGLVCFGFVDIDHLCVYLSSENLIATSFAELIKIYFLLAIPVAIAYIAHAVRLQMKKTNI